MKKEPAKPARPQRRHSFLPLAIGTSGGIALASIAFWFFKEQADRVVEGRADRYDDIVMEVIQRIDNPAMHAVMETVTQLGTHAALPHAKGSTR